MSVIAGTGSALGSLEGTKADQLDVLLLGHCLGDGFDYRVQNSRGGGLGQFSFLDDYCDQFSLIHSNHLSYGN